MSTLSTDLVAPGMVVFSKAALDVDFVAEDGAPQGVVVDVQTAVDDDGVIYRSFRCVTNYRGRLLYHVIPETEVAEIGLRDSSLIRSRFREVLGERAAANGLAGWRPRRGILTSQDVQAVQTAWTLLKAEGLVAE